MHHFHYENGALHAEDVSLASLADEIGTPFYTYSTATLTRHYHVFADAFSDADAMVCFAVKACPNIAVLATLARHGAGMDIVSEGELRRALKAGVAPERIVFSGVGKTRAEMAFALRTGIFAFNVESEAELDALSDVAAGLGATATIALRVNPDVDAGTHHKISTGKAENEFGVAFEDAVRLYRRAAALPAIAPRGVHMHIGSQITALSPFADAFARLRELVAALRGEGVEIGFVNLGGGLGVPYRDEADAPPPPSHYAAIVRAAIGDLGVRLLFEPGRLIAGNAGVLVTRVISVKRGAAKNFVIVDAAMNDLIRPTLYDAWHEIWPVEEAKWSGPRMTADVVGPVCETGDYLALARDVPELGEGDLLAVMTAGAYGASLASQYNSRPLVPEALVDGARWSLIRERPDFETMLAGEKLPPWLANG
jgi:diaminopimelate decarboxylase